MTHWWYDNWWTDNRNRPAVFEWDDRLLGVQSVDIELDLILESTKKPESEQDFLGLQDLTHTNLALVGLSLLITKEGRSHSRQIEPADNTGGGAQAPEGDKHWGHRGHVGAALLFEAQSDVDFLLSRNQKWKIIRRKCRRLMQSLISEQYYDDSDL